MYDLIRKVKLIGIEKEGISISKSSSFGYFGYYDLPFKLSESPDHRWQDIFDKVYQLYGHSKKRHAHILNDTILVHIAKADNLQTHTDIIKEIVQQTNDEVDRENERIKASIERGKEKSKEQSETLEKMKEKADKIKF